MTTSPIHGHIQINGRTVGEWAARRLTHPAESDNDYEVQALYIDLEGAVHRARGTITHHYGDGVLTLASEVLAWAAPLLPPQHLPEEEG